MERITLFLLPVLLICSITTNAQWTKYTTSNSGIPDNSIWDLAVDSSNTIWIATDYGLGSFDGTVWEIFDVNNAPIPPDSNNDFYAVFVDDQDHVWIGTDAGYLLEFDHYNNSWTDHTTFTFGDILAIRQDHDGDMWVGHSNGVQERIGNVWTEHLANLPSDYVTSIDVDDNNVVWIGTNDGVAKYDNVSQWENYTDANSGMSGNIWTESVKAGIGTDIWIGTRGGIYLFDQNSSWIKYTSSNSGLLDDEVNSIVVDTAGLVWVANDAASMGQFENNGWISTFFPFQVNFARVIIIDREGYKWVGCQNALIRYNVQGSIPTAVEETATHFVSLQAYPNPSTDHATISFETATTGQTLISIVDMQGREVERILDRILPAGTFETRVDVSHLDNGSYSVLLRTENGHSFIKLIISN